MAKKSTRISINAFERANNAETPVSIIEWNGLEIHVRNTLPLQEMMGFVNDVVVSCFDDHGVYTPEGRAFSTRLNILSRFANIAIPSDIKKRYEFAYSGAVEAICAVINKDQLDDIEIAIANKVDHLLDTRTMSIANDLRELVDAFKKLSEGIGDVYNNVSEEDVNALISAMTKTGEIDQDRLVQNIISMTK